MTFASAVCYDSTGEIAPEGLVRSLDWTGQRVPGAGRISPMSRGRLVVAAVVASLVAPALLASIVSAETEIRITRPLDGSTVRETVNVLVPVSSVPGNGFISCMVDDKFRCAAASKSANGVSFVFRWDTKAMNPDTSIPLAERMPRDGKHTITVQAYDADGMKYGKPKQITVYVSNSATKFMPAGGLKLRYTHKVGRASTYEFKYTLDLKRIESGANVSAAVGEAVEGAGGVVKRSVEDVMPDNTVLIRQKLVGALEYYQKGQPVPALGLATRAVYHTEDAMGRITYTLKSSSRAARVAVDLPNLPAHRVRIGDTWTQPDRIFRDAITGNSAAVVSTSTLEGMEWEGGQPCAKIKSSFSATMTIPFSRAFMGPLSVNGETIMYFGCEVGEVVSSVTTAAARGRVDRNALNVLAQSLGAQGAGVPSPAFAPAIPMGPGGPPGMEEGEAYPPPAYMPAPSGYGPVPGSLEAAQGAVDLVDVELVVHQTLSLVR